MSGDVILSVTGVNRSFGGVTAVDVDHLDVARCSVVALIGPNGAGKTTFFNVLTGFERADGGTWRFDGTDLQGKQAYAIARAGMVRTFQTARCSPASASWTTSGWPPRTSAANTCAPPCCRGGGNARTTSWASGPPNWCAGSASGEKLHDYAGTLSGGQRKLLELARSVMAAPKLLMLDEPMAGVNPALRQALLEKIRELPSEGITVLFVEHDMDVVSAVSDVVVCMAEGQVIASGTAGEVAADQRVVEAYLGGSSGDLRQMGPDGGELS